MRRLFGPSGIVRRAAVAIAAKGLGSSMSLLLGIVVARLLGAEPAGIYYLAVAAATFLGNIGRVGLDFVVIRGMAAAIADERWDSARGRLSEALRHSAAISGLFAAVLFLSAPWIADMVFHKPETRVPLQIAALAIIPFASINLLSGALKAQHRPGAAQTVESMLLPAATLVVLPLIVWGLPLEFAISSFVIAAGLTALIGRKIAFRGSLGQADIAPPTGGLWKAGAPFIGIVFINQTMTWSAVFVLGSLAQSSDVAVFSSAARLAMAVSLALVAINTASAGQFAALFHKGDGIGLTKAVRHATLLGIAIGLPVILLLAFAAETVMGLYGPAFVVGADALRILLLGQLFNVLAGPVGQLLSLTGNEKYLLTIYAIGLILQLALLIKLAATMSVTGAAIASLASAAFVNVVCYLIAKKKFGLRILRGPGQ